MMQQWVAATEDENNIERLKFLLNIAHEFHGWTEFSVDNIFDGSATLGWGVNARVFIPYTESKTVHFKSPVWLSVEKCSEFDRLYPSLPCLVDRITGIKENGKVLVSFDDGSPAVIQDAEGRVYFGFDIISMILDHLEGRWDSQAVPKSNAPKGDIRVMWEKPWVDWYLDLLKTILKCNNEDTSPKHFQVYLTHDVDAVSKTKLVKLRQFVQYVSGGAFLKGLKFAASHGDYDCFDIITSLESEYNFKSTFFMYSGTKLTRWSDHFRHWLLDPSYDICNKTLTDKFCKLKAEGWGVGWHGSVCTYTDQEGMISEVKRLSETLGYSVTSARQHFLLHHPVATPAAEQSAGIKADFTLGFNDLPGFRRGTARPFRLYNPLERKAFPISQIPMVIMDSQLLNNHSDEDAYNYFLSVLEAARQVKGTISLIWHQRVFSLDYGWGRLYERLLDWLKGIGAYCPVWEE